MISVHDPSLNPNYIRLRTECKLAMAMNKYIQFECLTLLSIGCLKVFLFLFCPFNSVLTVSTEGETNFS